MPKLTEEELQARAARQRRHPVWCTRRGPGMAIITGFSHWSDEEPPADMKHLYQQLEDGTWVRTSGGQRQEPRLVVWAVLD